MNGWGWWTAMTALEAGAVGALLLLVTRWVPLPSRSSAALLLLAMLHFLTPPLAHIPHFRPIVAVDVAAGAAWLDLLLRLLVPLQAVGLVVGLGIVGMSALRVRRARIRGTRIETGPVIDALREVVGDHDARYPDVYFASVAAPLATGLFRPTILLPPDAARLPARSIRMIMAHEVTHLRHRDPWAAAIRLLVLSIWWFHPIAWLLAARHRHHVELAADEAVVPRFATAREYCDVLLASLAGGASFPGVAAEFRARSMEQRFHRLLRPPRHRHVGSPVRGLLVVLVALTLPARFLEPVLPDSDPVRIRVVVQDPPLVIRSTVTQRVR